MELLKDIIYYTILIFCSLISVYVIARVVTRAVIRTINENRKDKDG